MNRSLATALVAVLLGGSAACSRNSAGGADSPELAGTVFLQSLGAADSAKFCGIVASDGRVAGSDDVKKCQASNLLGTFAATTSISALKETRVSAVTMTGEDAARFDADKVTPDAAKAFVSLLASSVSMTRIGDRWYVAVARS